VDEPHARSRAGGRSRVSNIRDGDRYRRGLVQGSVNAGARMSEAQRVAADDATLARAVVDGDDRALAELYRRHAGPCLGLARRVLGDRTLGEEVVQEVFVRTWRAPERFDAERGSMRSFLLAQVHGRAVDLLRA